MVAVRRQSWSKGRSNARRASGRQTPCTEAANVDDPTAGPHHHRRRRLVSASLRRRRRSAPDSVDRRALDRPFNHVYQRTSTITIDAEGCCRLSVMVVRMTFCIDRETPLVDHDSGLERLYFWNTCTSGTASCIPVERTPGIDANDAGGCCRGRGWRGADGCPERA